VNAEPTARCEGCGFAWYGATAADGLRALGHCIRCGGHVVFTDRATPPADAPIDPKLGPHQVLGAPRLDF
jgi:hypothetical protein